MGQKLSMSESARFVMPVIAENAFTVSVSLIYSAVTGAISAGSLAAATVGNQAMNMISALFAARQVDKRYVALAHGCPPAEDVDTDGWARIALPLARDWPRRPRSKVDKEHGRPSLTLWRALAQQETPAWADGKTLCRLELRPVTGRSHQLRVHLLASGCPIAGDALYDAPDNAPRLMLHAAALRFTHPASGQEVRLECAAPF